ncbi:MAG: hypothetical protein ACFFCQ_16600 [Promethearchaeota archaeon]
MKGYRDTSSGISSTILRSSEQTEKITSLIQISDIYDLLMLLASYDTLKRQVLITLAHIYPRKVSGAQLALLCNYSKKANMLYRGRPLEALEKDSLIIIERVNPKLFKIQLNVDNPIVGLFVQLCQNFGLAFRDVLLANLDRKGKDK